MSDPSGLDLLRGTVDLLVLQALAAGPLHGYAVTKWVKGASRGLLNVEDRALYIALHRLDEKKLVRGRWLTTPAGRRVKQYELTAAGRTRLTAHTSEWRQYVKAMGYVLRTTVLEGVS
jgi:PadR family transcriptional regulator, regulatory protein PadR